MRHLLTATALVASFGLAVAAQAQTSAPVGGDTAKGNAPLKHVHTVNDGAARPGANSFTEGQARQHILNSGYTDVTGLSKGKDGVWRGMATHNGASVAVAMDFKGNVTEGASGDAGAMTAAPAGNMGGGTTSTTTSTTSTQATGNGAAAGAAATAGEHHAMVHHHRMHHHRRHGVCAQPGPNGTACSGVSTLQNGVSDKETRAMQTGAHP